MNRCMHCNIFTLPIIAVFALAAMICGCSGDDSTAATQNSGGTLTLPSTVSVSAITGDSSITLSWAPVSGASTYNLYWTTAGVGMTVTSQTGTLIENVSSPFAHSGLINGTFNSYAVSAVMPNGESELSCQVDITATILGGFTACGTPSGTQNDPVYDLDLNPILPRPVSYDYITLADIQQISYFRSAAGHDYMDGFETCRSMKHYYSPYFSNPDWTTIAIYAPLNGVITNIYPEQSLGQRIELVSSAYPSIQVLLFHVNPLAGITTGQTVTAGQQLGYHISTLTGSDVAVKLNTVQGMKLVSYFDIMTDTHFNDYIARGVPTRNTMVISQSARDADPLTCDGVGTFLTTGTLPVWQTLSP